MCINLCWMWQRIFKQCPNQRRWYVITLDAVHIFYQFCLCLAPGPVSSLNIISSRRDGSSSRVAIVVIWRRPSERNGPYRYMLNYTADQSFPYPVTRSISTSSSSINLAGDDQSYSVPINNSLPFADFTVSLYAFNIRRGAGVKSAVMTRTEKTTSIGE